KRFRNGQRNVSSTVSVTPPDTDTDTDTEAEKKDSARKRGARLADDWVASADDWQAALNKLGIVGATAEIDKFRDYWKAQPGQRGVKLDWDATWRNWVRNSKGQAGNG